MSGILPEDPATGAGLGQATVPNNGCEEGWAVSYLADIFFRSASLFSRVCDFFSHLWHFAPFLVVPRGEAPLPKHSHHPGGDKAGSP